MYLLDEDLGNHDPNKGRKSIDGVDGLKTRSAAKPRLAGGSAVPSPQSEGRATTYQRGEFANEGNALSGRY